MKVLSSWLVPVVGSVLLAVAGRGEAELAARLVRDVDPTSYAGSSRARPFGPRLFTAFGDRELWVSDGGYLSRLLTASSIRSLGAGRLAWTRADGKTGAGYVRFVHHEIFISSYRATPWQSIGQTFDTAVHYPLLFEATDRGKKGLWVASDPEAVEIIRPLLPLPDGRLVAGFEYRRGLGYFVARHPTLGTALWATDTTAAGTRVVFNPAPGRVVPMELVGLVNGKLVLALTGSRLELWTSDGTERGTRLFKRLARGATVLDAFGAGGWAYLLIDDGGGGPQLWSSDGTPAGTRPLVRFASAAGLSGGRLLHIAEGRELLFFADIGGQGREPWWSDGTPSGTHRVADLCPGPCGTEGEPLATSQDDGVRGPGFLFSARTANQGLEPYWTDGSPDSALLLGDLCPGPCGSQPRDARGNLPLRTEAFRMGFTAETAGTGAGERALFATDGTAAGTRRLTPPGVRAVTGASSWDYDSTLVFAAADADFGEELWMTEGTPESTGLLVDLGRELDAGSYPLPVGTAGERLLFTAAETPESRSLWSSDGTAEGTVPLPLTGDPPTFNFRCAVTLGTRALLTDSTSSENAIWATDGTPGGTARLTPAGLNVDGCPAEVGGRAVFFGTDSESGSEPWVSDGTPQGTHRLLDLAPGEGGSIWSSNFAVLPARLLFRREDGAVWQTDGTEAGTHPVEPALATLETRAPVAQVGEKVFFVRTPEGPGEELWVADGPEAAPRRIAFPPGVQSFVKLLAVGSGLYVFTGEAALWHIDGANGANGAAEEAMPVLASGVYDAPETAIVVEGRLVIHYQSNLWLTDGTPEGTFALRDEDGQVLTSYGTPAVPFAGGLVIPVSGRSCLFWPGRGAARPIAGSPGCDPSLRAAGGRVFFPGFEAHTGVELWAIEEERR